MRYWVELSLCVFWKAHIFSEHFDIKYSYWQNMELRLCVIEPSIYRDNIHIQSHFSCIDAFRCCWFWASDCQFLQRQNGQGTEANGSLDSPHRIRATPNRNPDAADGPALCRQRPKLSALHQRLYRTQHASGGRSYGWVAGLQQGRVYIPMVMAGRRRGTTAGGVVASSGRVWLKARTCIRWIPGTGMTRQELNVKVMKQLMDNKMMGSSILREGGEPNTLARTPKTTTLQKSVSFNDDSFGLDSGISSIRTEQDSEGYATEEEKLEKEVEEMKQKIAKSEREISSLIGTVVKCDCLLDINWCWNRTDKNNACMDVLIYYYVHEFYWKIRNLFYEDNFFF